jgi:hypothetical protein
VFCPVIEKLTVFVKAPEIKLPGPFKILQLTVALLDVDEIKVLELEQID